MASVESVCVSWEAVEPVGGPGVTVYRTRTPSGWLVHLRTSLVAVEDPSHRWATPEGGCSEARLRQAAEEALEMLQGVGCSCDKCASDAEDVVDLLSDALSIPTPSSAPDEQAGSEELSGGAE